MELRDAMHQIALEFPPTAYPLDHVRAEPPRLRRQSQASAAVMRADKPAVLRGTTFGSRPIAAHLPVSSNLALDVTPGCVIIVAGLALLIRCETSSCVGRWCGA